jgi:hypothetical protein
MRPGDVRSDCQGGHAAHRRVALRHPIELAVSRAQLRNASGTGHTHTLNADAIRHLASIFEEPGEDEGMELRMVDE